MSPPLGGISNENRESKAKKMKNGSNDHGSVALQPLDNLPLNHCIRWSDQTKYLDDKQIDLEGLKDQKRLTIFFLIYLECVRM